ncbi:MAG: NAD(P)-dependent oxidoreductase [Alphaproteobacteria bacterium]|nr:NAD(P)-dependent oxidoreductase [Alphaproteobacteria bacterium]
MADARTPLGFVGLGLMGTPIALKLREAGYPLQVWGRTPAKLAPALQRGATAAGSGRALGAASDVVFLCVTDGAAVEAVVFGPDGIASAKKRGLTIVDHSSIAPDVTRRLAQRFKDETGGDWIDAPVSGGIPGVRNKTLAVMAGGDAAAFERVRPIVMSYAGRFTLMGPSGAGQTTKLVNQILIGVGFLVLAEATNFAERAGVDAARIPEAIQGGRADSRLLQEFMPKLAKRDYAVQGRIDILLKDLETIAQVARETKAATPLASIATDVHRLLAAAGLGAADNTEIMRFFDGLAPKGKAG